MALVDYSDSESDSESPANVIQTTKNVPSTKPAFQKAAPGKISVALPSVKPEPGQNGDFGADERPAKRARTGGAFSGFNSLLPAPKRAAAPKAGVSLKTSSEAAFSRNPAPKAPIDDDDSLLNGNGDVSFSAVKPEDPPPEPKFVGKATRFLPLSVSNKKKKKPIGKPIPATERTESMDSGQYSDLAKKVTKREAEEVEPVPKSKHSLFSVQQEDEAVPISSNIGAYEPLVTQGGQAYMADEIEQPMTAHQPTATPNPNSLEAVASEMNLTQAQRRQLFGRNGGSNANVMHFNLDSEYKANEELRQAGESVEHRAVKTIAPGKHSLQQLVNNARTQKDALDDKWADGKASRGAGGAKYGWST